MRVVLQRVTQAAVHSDGQSIAEIGPGAVALVGIARDDTPARIDAMAAKVAALRLFADENGEFERSLAETGGAVLVVSQFTLLAEVRKGRRPSFSVAAPSAVAEPLVERFVQQLREAGLPVAGGRFGARMLVTLANDGPVTIVLDSAEMEQPRRG